MIDVEALTGELEKAIISTKRVAAGVTEVPISLGAAKISGDMKMTVDMKAQKRMSTLSFSLNYQDKVEVLEIPVSTYSGIKTTITTQYGSSHPEHFGGVTN